MNLDDTIVAIATPLGRGGIGVVRLAGPQARAIADPMLRLKHPLEPGRAVFGELVEPCGPDILVHQDVAITGNTDTSSTAALLEQAGSGAVANSRTSALHEQRIDEVVVTFFAKPHSYTTDNVVEISA